MIGPSSESLADASFALSVSRNIKPTGLSVLSLTDVCGPMSSFDEAQRIADLLGKGRFSFTQFEPPEFEISGLAAGKDPLMPDAFSLFRER